MLARRPAKAAAELEIKFQLGVGAAEALQNGAFPPGLTKVSQLHAVYFDTHHHALRDAGFSLRVRRKGDTYIQTLKQRLPGGLFQRDEWETVVPGPDLDLAALSDTPVMAVIGDSHLAPAFTVEVERRTRVLTRGDTEVELSCDTGLIVAGERQDVVGELELELLSGSPQILFALARELQSSVPLTLLFASKAERGYRLIGHDGVAALRAQQTAVGPQTTGAEAFQIVMRDALVQVAGNARLLQRAHNPDVLHQMRVGVRRLRAALATFKAMLDAEGLNNARRETRWLTGELAPARDLDVLLLRIADTDEIEEDPGRAAFFRSLRIAQAEAYERALDAVRSDRFREMLLTLAEWIEVGGWLRLANDEQRGLRDGPATAMAAPVLDKIDRRLRRRSRRFKRLDAAARHDLRKQAKKLRYAASFFSEAFPERRKRRERYGVALKAMQDRLGELNDLAVARTVALAAVGNRSGELAFAAGLEIGQFSRREHALTQAANEALKAFRKVKPFWPALHKRSDDLNQSRPKLLSV